MNNFFKKKTKKLTRTYFIADIAANHDGSLTRAKKLISFVQAGGCSKISTL